MNLRTIRVAVALAALTAALSFPLAATAPAEVEQAGAKHGNSWSMKPPGNSWS